MRTFLGSGGRFIEREGVSTLSIHGYPWALRYLLTCVFKNGLFAFQLWVLKSFFENSSSTLVSVLKVFEKMLSKAF